MGGGCGGYHKERSAFMDCQALAKVVKEPANAELTTNGMQQPHYSMAFYAVVCRPTRLSEA